QAVPPLPDPGRRGDRVTPPPERPAYQPPATTLVAPTGPPAIAVAGPQADTIVRPGTANAASPGFEEEVRALLHRRLRVGSWLCLVGAAAVFGIAAARGQGWGDQDGLLANGVLMIGPAVGLVLLRRRPTLGRLRAIEVALFGGIAVLLGAVRYA